MIYSLKHSQYNLNVPDSDDECNDLWLLHSDLLTLMMKACVLSKLCNYYQHIPRHNAEDCMSWNDDRVGDA